MTERRCPNCGGLVGEDAEWCTQCFTRLGGQAKADPGESSPAAPAILTGEEGDGAPEEQAPSATTAPADVTGPAGAGERIVRVKGESIVWTCPVCETENPIETLVCRACGTPFRRILEQPAEPAAVDPGRAAALSLLFPGIGHYVVGRKWEAFARGVVFAFALITGLVSIGSVRAGSGGVYLLLMLLSFAVAAAVYVLSTVDAGRAAERQPPLLPPRALMYGGIGLMLLTLAVLTTSALRARG